MGAPRAAWQAAFRSETAAQRGMNFAQSLRDLVKAFEKIPHQYIIVAAKKHGYSCEHSDSRWLPIASHERLGSMVTTPAPLLPSLASQPDQASQPPS